MTTGGARTVLAGAATAASTTAARAACLPATSVCCRTPCCRCRRCPCPCRRRRRGRIMTAPPALQTTRRRSARRRPAPCGAETADRPWRRPATDTAPRQLRWLACRCHRLGWLQVVGSYPVQNRAPAARSAAEHRSHSHSTEQQLGGVTRAAPPLPGLLAPVPLAAAGERGPGPLAARTAPGRRAKPAASTHRRPLCSPGTIAHHGGIQ